MNKKYVKHGIAFVSTKLQKIKVNVLLAFGRAFEKISEKMNKKYVKHGIASVSIKSQKSKLTYYSRLEGLLKKFPKK